MAIKDSVSKLSDSTHIKSKMRLRDYLHSAFWVLLISTMLMAPEINNFFESPRHWENLFLDVKDFAAVVFYVAVIALITLAGWGLIFGSCYTSEKITDKFIENENAREILNILLANGLIVFVLFIVYRIFFGN